MLVDKNWGIMPPFGRCLSILSFVFITCFILYPNRLLVVTRARPEVTLKQWIFLEQIFRIKLSDRTWAKLVTLNTIHWYCEGPKPTVAAYHHDSQARQHKSIAYYFSFLIYSSLPNFFFHPSYAKMEDERRRAYIKQQATVQKKEGTSSSNPSIKRKPLDKTSRLPKKPKVIMGSAGVTSNKAKLPPPPVHGKSKGLMMGQGPVTEKRPVLLYEDPHYALKQLSSIVKNDDYEDLGNHSTEAMGDTGLFSLAQVCVCLSFPSIL